MWTYCFCIRTHISPRDDFLLPMTLRGATCIMWRYRCPCKEMLPETTTESFQNLLCSTMLQGTWLTQHSTGLWFIHDMSLQCTFAIRKNDWVPFNYEATHSGGIVLPWCPWRCTRWKLGPRSILMESVYHSLVSRTCTNVHALCRSRAVLFL